MEEDEVKQYEPTQSPVLDRVDQLHPQLGIRRAPDGEPLEVCLGPSVLAVVGTHPAGGFYAGRANRPYLVRGETLEDVARDALTVHLLEVKVDGAWRQWLNAGAERAEADSRARDALASELTAIDPWLRGRLVRQAG